MNHNTSSPITNPALQPRSHLDRALYDILSLNQESNTDFHLLEHIQPFPPRDPFKIVNVGDGKCGVVMAARDAPMAFKLAKDPSKDDLYNDFAMHNLILQAFTNAHIRPVFIPSSHGLNYHKADEWWKLMTPLTEAAKGHITVPTHAYTIQRIPPLPKITCRLLINHFCPRA